MDVWNGSATQLRLYQQVTQVSFPLLMRASDALGVLSKGAVDGLWVVDPEGILRFESPRSRPQIDRTIEMVLSLVGSIEEPRTGDFDASGGVDFNDFLLFAPAFGSTEELFDLDESGRVDFADFLRFATVFGGS